jgi:hypothetical protein
MITIEFNHEDLVFDSPNGNDGADKLSPNILDFTCFQMDIDMRYNGNSVFAVKLRNETIVSALNVSLLGFAVWPLRILQELLPHERRIFTTDGAGDVVFERISLDSIGIGLWNGDNTTLVEVPMYELLTAFLAFKERVRLLLTEKVPAIQKNPAWKEWFPESV